MEHFRQPAFDLRDYEDTPFYSLLRQLPTELARNHIRYIESNNLTDGEAAEHLIHIIEGRQEAVTTTVISDETLQAAMAGRETEIMKSLETTVYHNPDNYLGAGMTAKVKLFEVTSSETSIPVAVKYVITPTSKTITAEQEHNVIKEVERMRAIEQAELAFPRRSRFIRVPHPYFHHTTGDIQLYGMELIDGITLEQATTEGMLHEDIRTALQQSQLSHVTREELDGYIERFFDTMHEYCLHGDIKPRNIMVSRDGVLYVIDFGQSVMSHNIPKGAEEQFENLKQDEITLTKNAVHRLLSNLFGHTTQTNH